MNQRVKYLFQGVKINSAGTQFYVWITKNPNPKTRQHEPFTQSKREFWANAGLVIR